MCELMESSQQSHYCPHCTGEETETQTGNRRRQNLNPGSLVYCCGRWDLQGSPDLFLQVRSNGDENDSTQQGVGSREMFMAG